MNVINLNDTYLQLEQKDQPRSNIIAIIHLSKVLWFQTDSMSLFRLLKCLYLGNPIMFGVG